MNSLCELFRKSVLLVKHQLAVRESANIVIFFGYAHINALMYGSFSYDSCSVTFQLPIVIIWFK